MTVRKWNAAAAFAVMAAAGIGLMGNPITQAQDKKPAEPPATVPVAAEPDAVKLEGTTGGEEEGGGGTDVFDSIKDLGFARFIDVEHIGAAWHDLDASLMTDLALQLAEGERVLMRTHKSGFTAQKMFVLALKVSLEKRDKFSLERLGQVATARKDDTLATKVDAGKQVIAVARSADPAARLSVEDVSAERFAEIRDTTERITRLKLAGDKEALKALEKSIDDGIAFSPDQTGYLRKLVQDAAETSRGPNDTEADGMTDVLRQLTAATRGNESNRSQGRAAVEAGGWTVMWGVNINEAEYAKFIAAVVSAAASGNPVAIQQYISDYAERTWVKVKSAFPGAVKNTVMSFIVRAIKSGGSATNFGKMGVKAGIATYQRWYYVEAKVPDGTEKYKIHGPLGSWTWGYRPKFKTVQKKIPLPNHHTPYVAFRI